MCSYLYITGIEGLDAALSGGAGGAIRNLEVCHLDWRTFRTTQKGDCVVTPIMSVMDDPS